MAYTISGPNPVAKTWAFLLPGAGADDRPAGNFRAPEISPRCQQRAKWSRESWRGLTFRSTAPAHGISGCTMNGSTGASSPKGAWTRRVIHGRLVGCRSPG